MHLIVANRLRSVLLGLALLVIPRVIAPGQSIGALTGFTLYAFGIFALALKRWRSEPGLWMLATLLFVVYSPVYVYFQYQSTVLVFNNVLQKPGLNGFQLASTLDGCIALVVFGALVRFLMTVVVRNWQVSMGTATSSNPWDRRL